MVGALRPAEAIEAAHVYRGGMPGGDGKPLGSPPEPPQSVFKHRRLKGDIKRAQTVLGYHTAPALSDDDFALRILGHVLGAGRASPPPPCPEEAGGATGPPPPPRPRPAAGEED